MIFFLPVVIVLCEMIFLAVAIVGGTIYLHANNIFGKIDINQIFICLVLIALSLITGMMGRAREYENKREILLS